MDLAVATPYKQAVEHRRCTYGRCARRAAEDSDLCPKHYRAKKRRQAQWKADQRADREANGLCPHCPESGPPVALKPGEKSCLGCKVRRRQLPRTVEGVDPAVDKRTLIAARTKTHADGRTRYHGQPRRGQQPKAQLNRQDIGMAEQCLSAGKAGLALTETDEVKALPRIQREDVKRAALHQLARVGDHIDGVLAREGHFGKRHGPRGGDQ